MLTDQQRAALTAEAQRRGIDSAALIAEAEALTSGAPGAAQVPAGEKPNLYMYLLPFVTVNEVRTIWLELDPVAGGDQYAAEWAAKQVVPGSAPPVDETA